MGGEPAHSGALWSCSLGGFQTLQGAHEGEHGSPSVLNRDGEKQHNGHNLFSSFCTVITIFATAEFVTCEIRKNGKKLNPFRLIFRQI